MKTMTTKKILILYVIFCIVIGLLLFSLAGLSIIESFLSVIAITFIIAFIIGIYGIGRY